jgi:TldD protein
LTKELSSEDLCKERRVKMQEHTRESIEKAFENSRADYLEIRLEKRNTLSILYRGRELDDISEKSSTGGFIRALVNGGWGYASFTDMDMIPQLAEKAERAARIIGREKSLMAEVDIIKDTVTPNISCNPADISIEEKEALVRNYNDIIMNTDRVQTSGVSYSEDSTRKIIINSEGTEIDQHSLDMIVTASSIAREGDVIQTGFDWYHSSKCYNDLKNLEDKIKNVADKSVALLDAKPPAGGKFDVVADQRLSGVFAHEAFGHLSESDFVSQNKDLVEIMRLGREFGNSDLNIIDDGSIENLAGCSKYDDEGVKTRKNYLIKEGRLSGRLHNRETAKKMGEEPTGNARAVNFSFQPIVRMTCTYIDNGEWTAEEMIKDIDNGYYVKDSKGGQTTLEQFTFAGGEAFKIENGELTDHVRDLNISGNLFNTLKSIDAIGNDLSILSGGGCGKDAQYPLPVSLGGPHIRIRDALVGGG